MQKTKGVLGLWLWCSLLAHGYCDVDTSPSTTVVVGDPPSTTVVVGDPPSTTVVVGDPPSTTVVVGDPPSTTVVVSTTPTTAVAPTPATTPQPVIPPTDVSSHRNVGLINGPSCGRSSKIAIGSGNTTGLYEMPWMALLVYQDYEKPGKEVVACGGILINARYVLTATHCLLNYTRHKLVSVRLGDHDTSTDEDCEDDGGVRVCAPPPQNINVESFVKHPGYSPKTMKHNVGLIRLAEPAVLQRDSINTICLPVGLAEQTKDLNKKPMLVAGWGLSPQPQGAVTTNATKVVKKGLVQVVPQQQCQNLYQPQGVNITSGDVCARELDLEDPQRACAGIHGGGALMTADTVNGTTSMVQYGTLSFGNRLCDPKGVPDVYVHLGHHMDWILGILAP